MSQLVTILEELNIRDSIEAPHFLYVEGTMLEKRRVAYLILQRKEDEVLLIDRTGFLVDSVLAGLSEKHIEHIAKSGPRDYKENILKSVKDQKILAEVVAIAKAMDEDLGGGSTRHQTRVKNVIQYIKDNQVVFEF